MPSIIVDTNVFISGLIKKGYPSIIIDAINANKIALITSPVLIEELIFTATGPQLTPFLDKTDFLELMDLIGKKALIFSPKENPGICRDRKDDKFLACALASRADFLITGDKDLLILAKIGRTQITTPRKFVELIS